MHDLPVALPTAWSKLRLADAGALGLAAAASRAGPPALPRGSANCRAVLPDRPPADCGAPGERAQLTCTGGLQNWALLPLGRGGVGPDQLRSQPSGLPAGSSSAAAAAAAAALAPHPPRNRRRLAAKRTPGSHSVAQQPCTPPGGWCVTEAARPWQLGRADTERSGGTTKQGENRRRVQREQWRYRKEEGARERKRSESAI